MNRVLTNSLRAALAAGAIVGIAHVVQAETMLEYMAESRLQLDLKVPDAALAKMLPAGWEPNVATTGAAKDANLRIIFIDRMIVADKDNKPIGAGKNQMVYLAAPVKNTASGATAQMIIGGLTADEKDAPGPYGNYLYAKDHSVSRTDMTGPDGKSIGDQTWSFTTAAGDHFDLHIKYERGPVTHSLPETRYYSAKNPDYYQIVRGDQALDIMKNTTTNPPDHVMEFSFKASGPTYAALFPANVGILSWDLLPWTNKTAFLP